jgi:prepilin-type N-terminal cleavage/methylation domain-containing protein
MKNRGFTLIELLVVIAIIGILAVVIIAALGNARKAARDSKRAEETRNAMTAVEAYIAANGSNPVNVAALVPDYLAQDPTASNPKYVNALYFSGTDKYCIVSTSYEAKTNTYFYAKDGVAQTANAAVLPAGYAQCP